FDRATGKERRVMLQTITSSESYIILTVFAALALVALIYLLSPMSLPDEPLLYLIGVNHAVQFKSAIAQMFGQPEGVGKKRAEFAAHVAEMIDKLGIEVLAEEVSEETKRKSHVREKFGQTEVEQFSWETVLEQ